MFFTPVSLLCLSGTDHDVSNSSEPSYRYLRESYLRCPRVPSQEAFTERTLDCNKYRVRERTPLAEAQAIGGYQHIFLSLAFWAAMDVEVTEEKKLNGIVKRVRG